MALSAAIESVGESQHGETHRLCHVPGSTSGPSFTSNEVVAVRPADVVFTGSVVVVSYTAGGTIVVIGVVVPIAGSRASWSGAFLHDGISSLGDFSRSSDGSNDCSPADGEVLEQHVDW